MPLNEIQRLSEVQQPSQQPLCSVERFSSFIPVTCPSAPAAARTHSAGATGCQLLAVAITQEDCSEGRGELPSCLESFTWHGHSSQGKTACKPRARRVANAICHIDTELKQKPYYGRGQGVGLPPLLLWSLKQDCGFCLLCPLLLCFLFHTSTQLQWEGVNHPSPPRPSLQPGAFLLQVSKGEFKFREMSGEAGCDHSCLICLNSWCSPLRRSGGMVLLELGGGMRRNWACLERERVAEVVGYKSREPP